MKLVITDLVGIDLSENDIKNNTFLKSRGSI